jgi:RNA polymerase sigma-70 factor (ECF subfamily)
MGQDLGKSKIDEEYILVKKAKNDNVAFAELYDKYFPQIYGFIFKRIGQKEITEDIVSIVFIKVFTHLSDYKKKDCSFRSWLYRIAVNTIIDYHRKHSVKKEIAVDEFPEIVDDSQDQEQILHKMENQRIVQSLLDKMPGAYQKILQLKFFSELSNLEIAEVLDISPNNVGVLLYRALKKFKASYQRFEP